MNSNLIIAKYLTSTLSTLLSIPVKNGIVGKKQTFPFCNFFILNGKPTKFTNNALAFNVFDVRINIWSKTQYEYDKAQSVISNLDGVQGVEISNTSDTGYINSIIYNRQDTMKELKDEINYYGIQIQFTFKVK